MKLPANYPFSISADFGAIHFVDLYSFHKITNAAMTVDELTFRFFSIKMPFVDSLLRLRSALVKPLGLKGSSIPKQAPVFVRNYSVGEQIVLFTVTSRSDDE